MRKGKVAAAILCLFAGAGMLGGVTFNGNELSVARADQTDQILEVTEEAVTTATSIETTALVTTATSAKAKTVTTAAATTVTAKSTTVTTSKTTAATTTDTSATKKIETTTTEAITTAAPAETVTETVPVATEAPVTTTPPAEEASEPAPLTDAEDLNTESFAISVTDREYIMLCNVVGHEYGSDWVPEAEKALVAEVVMNRVNSPQFPNSIYEVLVQPNQFTGLEYLIEMDHMSSYVTQSVRDAVDLYLSNPSQFQHGYLFFNGDGYRNYFRATC